MLPSTTNDGSCNGTVYIVDQGNHRVLRWTPGSLIGALVAGGMKSPGRSPLSPSLCANAFAGTKITNLNFGANYRWHKNHKN